MIRRHSHSGIPSEQPETDWWQDSLTPYYLKRSYRPEPKQLPSVEVDPIEEAEPKKVMTEATHHTLLERYVQITEGS